jgi:hypothetical protein
MAALASRWAKAMAIGSRPGGEDGGSEIAAGARREARPRRGSREPGRGADWHLVGEERDCPPPASAERIRRMALPPVAS